MSYDDIKLKAHSSHSTKSAELFNNKKTEDKIRSPTIHSMYNCTKKGRIVMAILKSMTWFY